MIFNLCGYSRQNDVLVGGGGPAGTVCATLLARAGLKTALLVGAGRKQAWEIFEPSAHRLSRVLGLPLPDTAAGARICRGTLSRWRSKAEDFYDYELYSCQPAISLNRQLYDASLLEAALLNGVTTRQVYGDSEVQWRDHAWCLDIDLEVERASFFVDAAGRSGSFLRGKLATRRFHDRTVSCVTIHSSESVPNDVLLVEASINGWWYVAPAGKNGTCIVYSSDADLIPKNRTARAKLLRELFNKTELLRSRVDSVPNFNEHFAIDARTASRKYAGGSSWQSVGDARFAMDPLSGQGLHWAIRSAEMTAAAIQCVIHEGRGEALSDLESEMERHESEELMYRQRLYQSVISDFHRNEFWARRVKHRPLA